MTDFVIRKGEYPRLLELILEWAPAFRDSDEYARLHADAEMKGQDPERSAELKATHRAIERLAQSDDLEVANAVVVDIYEPLDLSPAALEAFRSELGPAAAALYDEWVGHGSPGFEPR